MLVEKSVTNNIIPEVRIILDHNEVTTALAGLGDVETLELDEIIGNSIEAASRQVVMMAPRQYVDFSLLPNTDISAFDDNYAGCTCIDIKVPFLRIGTAKLNEWKYGLTEAGDVRSDDYRIQFCDYAGLKATNSRPKMFLAQDYDGSSTVSQLQLFPKGTLSYLTCAVEQHISSNKIKIGDKLYIPTLYVCASLVAETLKDTEKSNTLMTIAKNMLINADSIEPVEA